ncbi:hypothetical protein BH23ACT12_BH23ACT12_20970 [soil metagenome]
MADATFTCDVCGNEFDFSQLKEFFDESGRRLELCPEDLDEKMNEAGSVHGGPGEKKEAAAYDDDGPRTGPYGEREAPVQR